MPSTIDLSSGCCTWFWCYSLEDSDRELLISVLLGGMKYSALTTSLLAQSELTVQQVEDALKNKEAHCLGAAVAAAASSSGFGTAPVSTLSVCTFCAKPRHTVEHCYKFQEYSKRAKEEVKEASDNSKKKRKNHPRPMLPRDPLSTSCRLSQCPDSWNADTGATTHMPPHREWFKSYGPSSVRIWVANGQVVLLE